MAGQNQRQRVREDIPSAITGHAQPAPAAVALDPAQASQPDGLARERIHCLWDDLADFDIAHTDQALRHLLAALCELGGAQDSIWLGAVRLDDSFAGDPVVGWRPRVMIHLHPDQHRERQAKAQADALEVGVADEATVRNVAGAGRFRANRYCDLASNRWFESDHYLKHFKAVGIGDGVWVAFPLSPDAESYFGIHRDVGQPRFTVAEREMLAYALRGLKWFHRQLMLSHGLLIANAPLTPVERQVLHGLLTGLSEKQIAAAQGQSYHTTHEYVRALYRKFGVRNRATLMALWLGKAG